MSVNYTIKLTKQHNIRQSNSEQSMNKDQTQWTIIDQPLVQDSQQKEKFSSSKRVSNRTSESIFRDSSADRRKKKKDPEKEVMEKYFGHYAYIDTRTLKSIKTYMEAYIAEEKAKDRHDLELLRSINRRQLLKILLIAYGQLKFKQLEPVNEVEQALIQSTGDCYSLITIFVCLLEEHLFQKLYKPDKKPREEPYQVKMKILKAQLNDKYNFDLRRAVINRTKSFSQIVASSEEDLKSQQRKQEEKISLKCLVDQSQSWPTRNQTRESYLDDIQATQEPAEQPESQKLIQHIPSVVIGIEDNEEQNGNKETEDEAIIVGSSIGYKKKLRKSIKSANRVYQKCSKDMRDRVSDIGGEVGARLKDHLKKTFK